MLRSLSKTLKPFLLDPALKAATNSTDRLFLSSSLCSITQIAYHSTSHEMHGTTVLCVSKDGNTVIMADGQVTVGSQAVVKSKAKKTRKIGEHVIGGFAGAVADCFTLIDRLETKIEAHPGQLTRAAVELAKEWRTDRYLRHLEASLVVADKQTILEIYGNGEVLQNDEGVISIGSGSSYAWAAAKALMDTDMDAISITKKAMNIAADRCVFTNKNFSCFQINSEGEISEVDMEEEKEKGK